MSKFIDAVVDLAGTGTRKSTPGSESAQAAMQHYRDVQQKRSDLTKEGLELQKKRQKKHREMSDAAIVRDEAKYEKLYAEHERIVIGITAHEQRCHRTDEELRLAHSAMKAADNTETLRAIETSLEGRLDIAKAMEKNVGEYSKLFRKYLEVSKSLPHIYPGAILPIGLLTSQGELRKALSVELYRAHPTGTFGGSGVGLPGSDPGVGLGPVDKIMPLSARVEEANRRVVQEVAKLFDAEHDSMTKKYASVLDAEPQRDPDEDVFTGTAPTQKAEQVLATMKPKRITMRKGVEVKE